MLDTKLEYYGYLKMQTTDMIPKGYYAISLSFYVMNEWVSLGLSQLKTYKGGGENFFEGMVSRMELLAPVYP